MSSWREDIIARGLQVVQEDAPRLIQEIGAMLAYWRDEPPGYDAVYEYAAAVRSRVMTARAAMFCIFGGAFKGGGARRRLADASLD
jgi:hypothetical protein